MNLILRYLVKISGISALIILAPISKLLTFNWDYFAISLIETAVLVFMFSGFLTSLGFFLYFSKALKFGYESLLSIFLIYSVLLSYVIPVQLNVIDGGGEINLQVREVAFYSLMIAMAIFAFIFAAQKICADNKSRMLKKIIHYLAFGSAIYILLFSAYAVSKAPSVSQLTGESRSELSLPLSSEKNIFIIGFDQIQGSLMNGLIDGNKYVQDVFKDFTFYSDAATTYPNTKYALSSILLGRMAENQIENMQFAASYERSFLNLAAKSGSKTYTNKYLASDEHQCLNCEIGEKSFNFLKSFELYRHSLNMLFGFDVGNFIGIPNLFLSRVPQNLIDQAWQIDLDVFEAFSENMRLESDEPAVFFMHFLGTHQPFIYDANCRLKPKEHIIDSQGVSAAVEEALCFVHLIHRFLANLTAQGVYENSTIIIFSDHGYEKNINDFSNHPDYKQFFFETSHSTGDSRNIKAAGAYNPMLFLKMAGPSKGSELKVNRAPVSLIDIAPTVCSILTCGTEWQGISLIEEIDGERTRDFWFYFGGAERRAQDGRDKFHDGLDDFWERRRFHGPIHPNLAISMGLNERYALRKISLNEVIKFKDGGKSDIYTIQGWSGQEFSHRWTEGNEAGLSLRIDKSSDSDLELIFDLSPYRNQEIDGQDVTVVVNGRKVALWEIRARDQYSARIPADIAKNGTLNITLKISNPAAPCDFGESTDCRVLGVAARSLVIKEVSSLQ